MATYVDGFLLSFKADQLPAYKKMAKEGREVWMKHGAIDYKECIGDDLTPKHVKKSFPSAIGAKPGEIVVFSYIVFKSKAERNQINKKVMAYFDAKYKDQKMPVEMGKFLYGGFKTIVEN